MSNYEVAELTWENGQLSMHELGGSDPSSKPLWARASGTLESIVHQATCHNPIMEPATSLSISKKRTENLCDESTRKRSRLQSQSECTPQIHSSTTSMTANVDHVELSRCASAMYCRDAKTTTSTSPNCSFNTKTIEEDDIACISGPITVDDKKLDKTQTEAGLQSHNSTRRSRVAAVHNQSERRRRDRINQKIRALQKLVPNSSKTDKASMLEEVVEYLKRLQAQIHDMMMSINNTTSTTMPALQPQMMMMMPMALQQQHQLQNLSLLASSMGMGVNQAGACAATPSTAQIPPQPPFLMHPMMQASSDHHHILNAMPVQPYYSFLAQSMNMDLYSKMGAIYMQQYYHHENMAAQANSTNTTSTSSQANHAHRHD